MTARELGPTAAQIARMRGHIDAMIVRRTRERRRRVRVTIAVSAAALAATVTAGSIAVATWPREVTASAYTCFSADDPTSTHHGIGYPTDLEPPDTTEGQVAAAIEMCDMVFGMEGVQAPDPTVCELPDLRLAVFPNVQSIDDVTFCTSLGLGTPGE